jgi:hypothetical protein
VPTLGLPGYHSRSYSLYQSKAPPAENDVILASSIIPFFLERPGFSVFRGFFGEIMKIDISETLTLSTPKNVIEPNQTEKLILV